MRILLLSTSYNSMTQAAHLELNQLGHDVSIEVFVNDDQVREGIELFKPELILCPMLTKVIPEDVWRNTPCIIVHPGIRGDRGPSSLDWAIREDASHWGVTLVEAANEMDSGPIWASAEYPLRDARKSSLYRDETVQAAMKAIRTAVRRFESGHFVPEPLDYMNPDVIGRCRPVMKQTRRSIDWQEDSVDLIIRKVRSADGFPGLLDEMFGEEYYLCGVHAEGSLVGKPGEILATRDGAICRAATDGAVWISHLKKKAPASEGYFKMPAADVLGDKIADVAELPLPVLYHGQDKTFKEIWYEEHNDVGYLHFDFYNGAMSTRQCERLTEAYRQACERSTRAIVLMGGADYWSNGIHLNVIEAATNPGDESWANINAINDIVQAMLMTQDRLVIAAMHGSAGAGGVMMALAADKVFIREGVVLNPHYKGMGGLYGSEFWTWSLPRRVGAERAEQLTSQCLPISDKQALEMGLIDDIIYRDDYDTGTYAMQIQRMTEQLAHSAEYNRIMTDKIGVLQTHSNDMLACREAELENMKVNFFGDDKAYHEARTNFVLKRAATQTPAHLARHRAQPESDIAANAS